MEYKNIDFHFSSDCNMACEYCFIKKDKKEMAIYNKKTREKILNNELKQNILKNLTQEELIHFNSIGLWGAEPTINADLFETFLNQMLEIFPNIQQIMFSTNSFLGYNYVSKFIFAVNKIGQKYNKKNFKLTIQFSLDGPAWLNEQSRKIGATQRTIDTIDEILEKINSENFKYSLMITSKITLSILHMKEMVENSALMKEYFDFFNDFKEKENKNNYIETYFQFRPTLVIPGYYTKEDGITFAKWLAKIIKFNKIYKMDTIQTIDRIRPLKEYDNELIMTESFGCGAGKGSVMVNADGDLFVCHQLARFACYEDERKDNILINQYSTLNGTSKALMKYNSKAVHAFEPNYYENFKSMAKLMAKIGLIEPIYEYDLQAIQLLFLMSSAFFCFISYSEETKDPFFVSPSALSLFGNGAAELLYYYSQTKVNENE